MTTRQPAPDPSRRRARVDFAAACATGDAHERWMTLSGAACAVLALPLSIWALPGPWKAALWAAVVLAGAVMLVHGALWLLATRRIGDAVRRL